MHSSLSSSPSPSPSSSASSYVSCTRLHSISYKKYPKSMAAVQPCQEILQNKHRGGASYVDRFIESEDVMSSYSMQKTPAAGKSLIIEQCNKSAEAQAGDGNLCKQGSISNSKSNYTSTSLPVCHSNDNLNHMFEASPSSDQANFQPSTTPNPDPNCVHHPGREVLEEGQGECNPDHVCSVKGSPSLWDNSEDLSWRRPSPAAASCFCKDVEEEQEYFQQVLGSSSHGWTDEKHSSYLDSMEADFLRSVMLKEGTVPHAEPSPDLDDSASSHQAKAAKEFKVCQSGRWRPVYVQAPYVNIGPLKQLAVAVKNPWIKRFRASKRAYFPSLIMEDPLFEEANAHCNAQQHEEYGNNFYPC